MLECNVWRVIRTVLEMTHLWLWPILGMGSPLRYLWSSQLVTGSKKIYIYIYQNHSKPMFKAGYPDITAIYNWVSHMAVTYNILQKKWDAHRQVRANAFHQRPRAVEFRGTRTISNNICWLVVSTPLKNISQLGWLIPKIWNNEKCSKPPTSMRVSETGGAQIIHFNRISHYNIL